MSTQLSLDMQVRTVLGKKVKHLRKEGLLPATVYGKGIEPLSVQVSERSFQTIYRQAGRTALVVLNIPGQWKKPSAFIQEVQRHPVKRDIIHADFRVVDLTVAIDAEVPVTLVGKSLLVERGDAIINHGLSTIEIHALPENVPPHIDVDISGLDSFEKSIHVSDLQAGDDYTFVTPGDALVVSLTQTRAVVTEETDPEGEGGAEPALIRKEREET
jgi:large subunit ribosomal protein L25